MTGFQHDIAGGNGALVIPALHSPNYVPGVSGWAVFENGNVEFNSGTFRGTVTAGTFTGADFVINSAGAFFYSGAPAAGNLIASIASVAGTDSFGNNFASGITSYVTGTQWARLLSGGVGLATTGWSAGLNEGTLNSGLITLGLFATDGTNTHISGLDFAAQASPQVVLRLGNSIVACDPSTAVGAASIPEAWHAVTVPTGMTGTIRVKLLAEGRFAALDVNVSITSSLTTANTYGAGSLPSAAYNPASTRQFPLSVNGLYTATSNASPRVAIASTGGVSLPMPGFASAGVTVSFVSGLIVYPLD